MKKHILVVDDEKHIRDLCKDILEDEGFRVSIAKNGKQALEKMDKDYFELYLVDMIMPGMDGLELLKKIKKKQPLAIVIITTGFSSIEGAVKAVHSGAFQYLSKPINANELISMVQKGFHYSEHLYGPLNKAFRISSNADDISQKKSLNIIFNNINDEDKIKIISFSKTKTFTHGEDILFDNEALNDFLIVESGEISVWVDDASIDYLRQGDIWGEEELLIHDGIFASLKAETNVEIRYFEKKRIIDYITAIGGNLEKTFYLNLTNSIYYKWRKSIQRLVLLKMVAKN